MRAMTAPTATLSPCSASCSVSTPATGEGTSTLTLSVSRLAIGSSAFTASPGFFSHSGERAFGDRFPERRDLDVNGHAFPLLRRDSVDRGAAMAERRGNQGRLLGRVPLGEPGRRRSGRLPARIKRPHAGKTRVGEALLD